MPYGSYYLTGFLHERPLARLRDDLAKIGIERAEGNCEPEDHAGMLCEIMSGLGEPPSAGAAGFRPQIFEKHMAPWIGRFFADLEQAEAADFYRRLGTLGRVFMEIETEAFALPTLRRAKRRTENSEEGTAMKQQEKSKLGRRDFLRALGAGAGLAVTAAAPLATEAVASESEARNEKGPLQGKPTT